MKVARIVVEQQLAQLQVEVQLGTLKMDMSHRRGMKIESDPSQLLTETVQPEVEVDLSGYRYRVNMKSNSEFAQDLASRASQIASDAVETMAADGNYVGTLPQQGNAISQVAKQHMLNDSTAPFNSFSLVPPNVVDLTLHPGSVDINKAGGDFNINWDQVAMPELEFDPPPSVDVYVAQKPRLEFQVVETEIPPDILGEIDEIA